MTSEMEAVGDDTGQAGKKRFPHSPAQFPCAA